MLSFDMGAGVGRSYRYYTGKNLLYPMGFGKSHETFPGSGCTLAR